MIAEMDMYDTRRWLPTSVKEMERLGWDSVDVVIFSGDAYVDHPSFGAAVIGRILHEVGGYRVAIVPQPNWRDDLRDFRKRKVLVVIQAYNFFLLIRKHFTVKVHEHGNLKVFCHGKHLSFRVIGSFSIAL